MKVTFVHVGREHLGIEYLSSVLKDNGFDVGLAYDPGLFSREDNVFYSSFFAGLFSRRSELIGKIVKDKPDVIAFSAYTTNYRLILGLAKEIKEKSDIPVVFGGAHPTLVPDEVIGHDFVDFLIRGEAEYSFLDLLISLRDRSSLGGIGNLWYKRNGQVIKNDLRPPVKDLDSLPFPDKDLFRSEIRYRDDYMIMASRGCPCNCSYCSESYLNKIYCGKYFRRRNIDSVIGELKAMKDRYGFKRVMFFDGIFFTDGEWVESLLYEYKKEIGVPFRCTGHVSFVNDKIIKLMKDAGCYCIDFGVQTFNENIRRDILNRHETDDQIEKAFDVCDKVRLRYDVDLIFGLPSVSDDDYLLPVKFMDSHRYFNRLKCYYLSYFPKLQITERARRSGLLDDTDIEEIERGNIGDWFHLDSIKDMRHKRWKEDFEKFYKVYPIIPSSLRKFIVRHKFHRFFHLIPRVLIVLIQLLIGLCKKDYRFVIYINNYLYHAKKRLLYPLLRAKSQ